MDGIVPALHHQSTDLKQLLTPQPADAVARLQGKAAQWERIPMNDETTNRSDDGFDQRLNGWCIRQPTWHFHQKLYERYGIVMVHGEFTEMMNDIRLGRAELIERQPGRRAIPPHPPPRRVAYAVLEAGLRRHQERQGRHRAASHTSSPPEMASELWEIAVPVLDHREVSVPLLLRERPPESESFFLTE